MSLLVKRVSLVRAKSSDPEDDSKAPRMLLPAESHALFHIPYRNRILFFRKPKSMSSFEEIVSQMKETISFALVHFYTLAGRICIREDLRMDLLCNNAGIQFIEARCNASLGSEDEHDLEMQLLDQLCQAPGHNLKWPWPADAPLLFIQVTEFSCGGFCLGLKYSHQLLDGTSLWHFVKSWSEISCGKPVLLLPDIVPDSIQIPDEVSSSSLPPPLPPGMKVMSRNQALGIYQGQTSMISKRFRFAKSQIQALKSQHQGFTTFQLLSSYIWCKITRARELEDEETSSLIFAINCRERISSLSKAYFGMGALGSSSSTMTSGELKAAPLELVVANIKQAIKAYTAEERQMFKKANAYFSGDPLSCVALKFCRGRDIAIGSSFNFPVYQEFAWGTPFEMAMAQVPGDGLIYYFPGREQGSVYAYISLEEKVMQRFEAALE